MSNVAEGFERGSNAEFIRFLYMARGSCGQVRSQLYLALDIGYGSASEVGEPKTHCERLSRRLQTLIEYLKHSEYKGSRLREEEIQYRIEQPET
jgi:four helix bundle protein